MHSLPKTKQKNKKKQEMGVHPHPLDPAASRTYPEPSPCVRRLSDARTSTAPTPVSLASPRVSARALTVLCPNSSDVDSPNCHPSALASARARTPATEWRPEAENSQRRIDGGWTPWSKCVRVCAVPGRLPASTVIVCVPRLQQHVERWVPLDVQLCATVPPPPNPPLPPPPSTHALALHNDRSNP
jgi:hypothetical protein